VKKGEEINEKMNFSTTNCTQKTSPPKTKRARVSKKARGLGPKLKRDLRQRQAEQKKGEATK